MNDIKEKIIEEIKKDDLLTISKLASRLGYSRITVMKYVHELLGAGKIKIIEVGRAKILRLRKDG